MVQEITAAVAGRAHTDRNNANVIVLNVTEARFI
jgi:hypothetical protein